MAKRTLNRMDLRADYEAAERRKREEEEVEEEEGDEEEEDEDEEGGEEEGAVDADEDEDEDEEEEEYDEDGEPIRKKKKPKKKKEVLKTAKPKRSRAAKIPRMRVVWMVFDNSNRPVSGGRYDYSRRSEADEHATRLTTEKKQTFFVQAVKEPMEEKPA